MNFKSLGALLAPFAIIFSLTACGPSSPDSKSETAPTPPVGAFWSTTMYDAKKRLMTENSINRYKIGSADNLKTGADGSTTIYIQSDSPGKDKESNWLPAPKEPFYMLFRMYQPDIEVLNGQYELPGVVKAK